jgi:hypothetical protein
MTLLSVVVLGGAILAAGFVIIYLLPRYFESKAELRLPEASRGAPVRTQAIYDLTIDEGSLIMRLGRPRDEVYTFLDESVEAREHSAGDVVVTARAQDAEFAALLANLYSGALSSALGAQVTFEAQPTVRPVSPDVNRLLAMTALCALGTSLALGLGLTYLVARRRPSRCDAAPP